MDSTAQRPLNLIDLPQDCIGRIVQKLEQVSDDKQPLCRTLLHWAQASKDSTGQLAFWTHQHAKPADYAKLFFDQAFASKPPITLTFRRASSYARHLSKDVLVDITFTKVGTKLLALESKRLALALAALTKAKDQLPEGAADAFFQQVESYLFTKDDDGYHVTNEQAEELRTVCRTIYKLCGLIPGKTGPKKAIAKECMDILLALPQSLKSCALHTAFAAPIVLHNKEFKELLLSSAHKMTPAAWDDAFMSSLLGTVTLNACDGFIRSYRAESEDFIAAYAALLGDWIATLPSGERDFKTLCDGLYDQRDVYNRYSDSEGSDDDGRSPEQKLMKEMLGKIFYLLYVGQVSKSCKQAFLDSFVRNGLMTAEELDFLMSEFAKGSGIYNFHDLANELKGDDRSESEAKAPSRKSKQQCVIS